MCSVCLADDAPGFEVAKIGDSVVDANALTIQGGFGQAINGLSFQQEAVITHGQHQYVGYYDGGRRVCIARRKLPAGKWEVARFTDYAFQSNDAHNTISIGVCPGDGTIHIAFDHHNHPLHYRMSRRGAATKPEAAAWCAALFGPVTSRLEKDKPVTELCYPRFWQTPGGGLQFGYRYGRSGSGNRMLVDYDAKTGDWRNTRQIDSGKGVFRDARGTSSSRCSYPNGYTYGPKGRLHATWVWRESSQGANHDLVYVYSDDGGWTWRNNKGRKLAGPPGVYSPDIKVVDIPRSLGLMNTHGQAVDSQGRVHVVMWHCTERSLQAAGSRPGEHRWGPKQARRFHHYWRDRSGKWRHHELPGPAGSRPKIFMDANDNAVLIYSDSWSRGLFSRQGGLRILAATCGAEWKDWRVIHTEQGPFVNEMLGDPVRWKRDGVLSVMVQGSPGEPHDSTPLRILDFRMTER